MARDILGVANTAMVLKLHVVSSGSVKGYVQGLTCVIILNMANHFIVITH